MLAREIGRRKQESGLLRLLSRGAGNSKLSLARFFLFGARDVWVYWQLPSVPRTTAGCFWEVGGFMALGDRLGIVQPPPNLRRAGAAARRGPAPVQSGAPCPAVPALSPWRSGRGRPLLRGD